MTTRKALQQRRAELVLCLSAAIEPETRGILTARLEEVDNCLRILDERAEKPSRERPCQ